MQLSRRCAAAPSALQKWQPILPAIGGLTPFT